MPITSICAQCGWTTCPGRGCGDCNSCYGEYPYCAADQEECRMVNGACHEAHQVWTKWEKGAMGPEEAYERLLKLLGSEEARGKRWVYEPLYGEDREVVEGFLEDVDRARRLETEVARRRQVRGLPVNRTEL